MLLRKIKCKEMEPPLWNIIRKIILREGEEEYIVYLCKVEELGGGEREFQREREQWERNDRKVNE